MKRRFKHQTEVDDPINKIVGLGNKSIHKSYYPELRQKISELDQQRCYYHSILNSLPDSVAITDLHNNIIEVNQALLDKFGYSATDLNGKHLSMLYAPGEQTIRDETIWKETARYFMKKDGSLFIGESLTGTVDGTANSSVGRLEIIRDISDKIAHLEQQKALEDRLRQSQKMEALGNLAGGIAHDFNNLLTGIIGYGEMIEIFNLTDQQEISNSINKILKSSYQARDLVQQILAFSRRETVVFTTVHMKPLIAEIMELLAPSLPEEITISAHINSSADAISGNPTQMHQVLLNLCTNAVHAMRISGGTLRISLSECAPPDTQQTTYGREEPRLWLLLEISDTGSGIPGDTIEHIFEPYFTTKKTGEGSGIGLALVDGIIRNHNGYIEVDSQTDIGSTFRIFLPASTSPSRQNLPEYSSTDLPRGQGQILFVDDQLRQLEWAEQFLTRLGYSVTALQSSEKACSLFHSTPFQFDLVITDLAMPGLDGIELSRCIRKLREDIPIILCTGFSNGLSSETASKTGISQVLNKPVSLSVMAQCISNLLTTTKGKDGKSPHN